MNTAEQIREAAKRGRKAIEQRAAENREASAAHEAQRLEAWAAFDQKLTDYGVPPWALEYYKRDEGAWPNGLQALELIVPGCAPILAILPSYNTPIRYMVDEPMHVEYEGDTDTWYVNVFRQMAEDADFDVAVAQAEAWGESYHEMATEAARRNEQGIKPEPRVPLRQRIAAVDPAGQIVNILDGMLHTQAEAGPLWAALSIGLELRRISVALDAITVALTLPADDDTLITE